MRLRRHLSDESVLCCIQLLQLDVCWMLGVWLWRLRHNDVVVIIIIISVVWPSERWVWMSRQHWRQTLRHLPSRYVLALLSNRRTCWYFRSIEGIGKLLGNGQLSSSIVDTNVSSQGNHAEWRVSQLEHSVNFTICRRSPENGRDHLDVLGLLVWRQS